jgi:hypothetical protein
MFDPAILTVGARYLFVHQDTTQRYARVSLMTYLGPHPNDPAREGQWNARPLFGTQTMRWAAIRWVREVKPAARIQGESVFLSKDARNPMTGSAGVFAGPRIEVTP